ncbi:MAG: MerR family transcriptional regulator [Rhodospirillaceae bacterium]|nr:MerR family transcriptional regulator [Rhodospirillaceae bacterium]
MPGVEEKAPSAYRTISEVSVLLDVPQHVLRFWETKFAPLRPMKRGGGRRYYRPEDVTLLTKIKGWLYDEGLTIKGAQKRLKGRGIRQALADEGEKRKTPVAEAPAPMILSEAARHELAVLLADLRALRDELA